MNKFFIRMEMKDGTYYYVGFAKVDVNNGFVKQTVYGHEWTLDKNQARRYDNRLHAEIDLQYIGANNGAYIEQVFTKS